MPGYSFYETNLLIIILSFSLRPRASSSSSQSERSASPLVMNSTQSLDIMPRFAVAAEEEGVTGNGAVCALYCAACVKPRFTLCFL